MPDLSSDRRPWLRDAIAFLAGAFVTALVLKSGVLDRPGPPPSGGEWGHFSDNPKAEWLPDGRRMRLLEDFTYTDPRNRTWVAPAGWVVDGASIPKVFWGVIGGPLEGPYRNASICHDVECDRKAQSWADVHRMFYDGCRCGGLPEKKAKLMYAAVYLFGPRWEEKVIRRQRQVIGSNGKWSTEAVETRVRVPTQLTQQPGEEVRANLEKYIEDKNPSLEDIEKMDPKAVRATVPD